VTADQYAPAVLQAGRDLGITPRGIVIGFATVYVESGWVMYANEADPESLNYPHDDLSADANSDGLFQQRDPWWGTAAQRMDPYQSAVLFFTALKTLDYNSSAHSPGWYAQQVQLSAFPDRYDERMEDAQDLYDRLAGTTPPPQETPVDPNRPEFNEYADWLSANYSPRDPGGVDLWLLHTQEPPEGPVDNDAAKHLRDFLESSTATSNPVSYHYSGSKATDGGTTVIDCVDTNDACWAVGNSNDRTINFCFAGSRSDMSREEWIERFDTVIDAAAYLFVQDCTKYPNLQPRVIAPEYSDPPGAADHNYCTEYLRDGNNHTDVGPNFPWDVFTAAVAKYADASAPAPDPTPNPAPTGYQYPSQADMIKQIWEQLFGPQATGWPQLGGRTLVDAVSSLLPKQQ
jgi:hypothetical protein